MGNDWTRSKQLHTSSGTISAASPFSVQTLVNATSLNQGRLLGIAFSINSYPGIANPPTAPLEGEFKIYLDGANTPSYSTSGTEDYIGLSNYFQGIASTMTNGTPNIGYNVAPYVGLTFNTADTWNAYHFHIMDPVVFQNALKMTWDAGETTAHGANWTGTVRFAYCVWYYTE